MQTTHHLTETEIKTAIINWVKSQDKRAANMEVTVFISHDPGEPPYHQKSFTATATLKPVQHFHGKD